MSIMLGQEHLSDDMTRRLAYQRSVRAAAQFAGRSEFDGQEVNASNARPERKSAPPPAPPPVPSGTPGTRTYVPSALRLDRVSARQLVVRDATRRVFGRAQEVHALPIGRVPRPGDERFGEAWLAPVSAPSPRPRRQKRPSTPPARSGRACRSATVRVINPVEPPKRRDAPLTFHMVLG